MVPRIDKDCTRQHEMDESDVEEILWHLVDEVLDITPEWRCILEARLTECVKVLALRQRQPVDACSSYPAFSSDSAFAKASRSEAGSFMVWLLDSSVREYTQART